MSRLFEYEANLFKNLIKEKSLKLNDLDIIEGKLKEFSGWISKFEKNKVEDKVSKIVIKKNIQWIFNKWFIAHLEKTRKKVAKDAEDVHRLIDKKVKQLKKSKEKTRKSWYEETFG